MSAISGIEIVCDKHPKDGPVVMHKFTIGVDFDGDPMIVGRCPKCNGLIEIIFVDGRKKNISGVH